MSNQNAHYELRCRECGRRWGNQPRSICDECFSPLEVAYDYDWIRYVLGEDSIQPAKSIRERISRRPANMWRYAELLPLPAGFEPGTAGDTSAGADALLATLQPAGYA